MWRQTKQHYQSMEITSLHLLAFTEEQGHANNGPKVHHLFQSHHLRIYNHTIKKQQHIKALLQPMPLFPPKQQPNIQSIAATLLHTFHVNKPLLQKNLNL